LFWVIFLFSLTFTDYLSRRTTVAEQTGFGVLTAPPLQR
jgi:hypothetical protein